MTEKENRDNADIPAAGEPVKPHGYLTPDGEYFEAKNLRGAWPGALALYTAPPAASNERSTGICFFCGEPMNGKHEHDCPQAAPDALTDEQIKQVWKAANGTHPDNGAFGSMVVDFARALLRASSATASDKEICND